MNATPSPIQRALAQLAEGQDLSAALMTQTMTQIMQGEADPAAIGGFLMAMKMKGESVEEMAAAAGVMRQLATPVSVNVAGLTDIVGTGGDGASTFNVSTASAFVAATAGVRMAKHGNRSVSSRSGAADLLEAGGCYLDLKAEHAQQLIETLGIAFLFAPQHHAAMRHAIAPRRALGCWTLFNLLGPLTNPAGAPHQVLGVFSRDRVLPMAQTLQRLGAVHALVVHSEDGLDEISSAGRTHVAELNAGTVSESVIEPNDFGLTPMSLEACRVDGPKDSLAIVERVLRGQDTGAPHAMVALNAGAAIYVGGQASSLVDGVECADQILKTDEAWALFERYAQMSQTFAGAAE